MDNSPQIPAAAEVVERESGDFMCIAGKQCAKRNNVTLPEFGLCRKISTVSKSATSQQGNGLPACHMPQESLQDGAKT